MKYYISLVHELIGYFVVVIAPSELCVRQYAAKYYGRLWCSVYTEKEFNRMSKLYDVKVINIDKPTHLEEGENNE